MNSLHRVVVVLLVTSLLGAPASRAFNTGDIVVDNTRGEARLTQAGKERDVRRGQVVLVPATLRTGRDGVVDLRQGATMVNVGPETVLEFPAAQERGEPVERIVQSSGNAFYDVGKREGRRLRVETPYLVAVIKGTQFSVSVQADSTSISLVEGSLEILSGDGGATVDLEAGEVAIRRRGEGGITVVDIDAVQVRVPGAGGVDAAVAANDGRAAAGMVADVTIDGSRTGNGIVRVDDAGVEVGVGRTAEVTAAVDIAAGAIASGEVSIGVDLGAGQATSVELATAVDVRGDGVAVETGTAVDVGAGGVDVTAGADLGLGAAGASVDAGLGAAVDVGSVGTEVDVGLTADLDASPGADVAVDAGVAGVDAGISAGVDLGTGSVDLGVDVGGLDIDAGLDLGLGDDAADATTGGAGNDTQGGGIVENVGGLLDGLLRRPR